MHKPIYFSLSVWGEKHRGYLLNYCIPSLLAPNNIPCLKLGQQNKFIIGAPAEDWDAIDKHPIIRTFRQYITVVHIEIPPCPPDSSVCMHSNIGYKAAIQMMWKDQVYGSIITPDQLFADGCMSFLQETEGKGYDAIFAPANLRTRADYLFPAIETVKKTGFHDKSAEDNALIITKRDLVRIKEKSIHDAHKIYEWGKIRFASFPILAYWRIYNQQGFQGFLYYTLSWAMALIDYSAIKAHDESILDVETMDGSYIDRYFGQHENVYFVTNSDEYLSNSWSEGDEYPCLTAYSEAPKFIQTLRRICLISLSFNSKVFDGFKRRNFKKAIIYTCSNQTDSFIAMQKKADRLLSIATARCFYIPVFLFDKIRLFALRLLHVGFRLIGEIRSILKIRTRWKRMFNIK